MKIIFRKKAKGLKLNRYFTGKLCKNGHISERNTKTGNCLICCRNRAIVWSKNNIERKRET